MRNQSRSGLLSAAALIVGLPVAASAQELETEIITLPEWQTAYDDLYTGGISVDELLGSDVAEPTGDDDVGDVENILFSEDGSVLSLIAEVGGFIDIGDTHVNVPWDEVEVSLDGDTVVLPVTQDTIEDYTLFTDQVVAAGDAATDIVEVEGDGLGTVNTGPRVWRATELIGDYVRLRDGDVFTNYGYVDDLIIRDGQIAAVVVSPDVTWGTPGYYAYPYYGYGYGWNPGLDYYELPYERTEIEVLEPLDYERFDD